MIAVRNKDLLVLGEREYHFVNNKLSKPGFFHGEDYGHKDDFTFYVEENHVNKIIEEAKEAAAKEHKETRRRMWQGFHDESVDLKKRIAKLEAETRPVEISRELANVIEWMKGFFAGWNVLFVENRVVYDGDIACPQWVVNVLKNTGWSERVDIVKYGYTVKPDPLRSTISAIWQEYEDGHINQTEALDKITEVAKAHARTQSSTETEA